MEQNSAKPGPKPTPKPDPKPSPGGTPGNPYPYDPNDPSKPAPKSK